MLSPDEMTQTTEALEQLPRTLDRRSSASERRQSILQHKQTEGLPVVTTEPPNGRVAWRQVILFREENRRLRGELEDQQAELQRLMSDYTTLRDGVEQEVAVIHNGYRKEIEQYQTHLQEMMEERNRLQEANAQLEQRYQELYHTFRDEVEQEARKMMTEAAQTVILAPEKVPDLLHDVVKTVELQVRQEEDKHLVEALYFKREVQRIADLLEQERQQMSKERQQLAVWQNSVREQAELRYKTLDARLRTRWRTVSVGTSVGLLALLVVLQFICLAFLHVAVMTPVAVAILAPIVLCVIGAIVLAGPLDMLKHFYLSVPHKKTKK